MSASVFTDIAARGRGLVQTLEQTDVRSMSVLSCVTTVAKDAVTIDGCRQWSSFPGTGDISL